MSHLLEVQGLTTAFTGDYGKTVSVDHIHFHVDEKEVVCIVGESGCGKSVTSLSIMGLLGKGGAVTDGSVLFDGKNLLAMTEKIRNVWKLNAQSQQGVSNINDSVSSMAAVSEEISSSMAEMQNQLRDSADFMNKVSEDLKEATQPVVEIEKTLDDTVKQMGDMTKDAFFHLEKQEFAQYMSNAISSHHTWLDNLRKMVYTHTVMPLQLDSSKCGFGHFYYAMTPDIPGVLPLWEGLGPKHQKFHKYGESVIRAINSGRITEAEQLYREAETYSKGLISDMQRILELTNENK